MQKGKIVKLAERDMGFIQLPGVSEHLFFHADSLVDVTFKELREGDALSFTVTKSLKGPYATQIRRV